MWRSKKYYIHWVEKWGTPPVHWQQERGCFYRLHWHAFCKFVNYNFLLNWAINFLSLQMLSQNRTLTGIRINPILYLESPIVQISNFDRLLLVSTYARCILCDMHTEQFKQVREEKLILSFKLTVASTPTQLLKEFDLNILVHRSEIHLGMAITVLVSCQFTISIRKCF